MAINFSLSDICNQRKKRQTFNTNLLPRLELVDSPYNKGYTKDEIDMRRKAEILKYGSNVSITKSQNWSKIVNGKSNPINCKNDRLIPTPTSSCNVPGPIIFLIDNEKVPLYNYKNNTNSYSKDSINNQENRWLLNPSQDILLLNGESTKIFSLLITNKIDKASYIFSINIPISIYISGTNLSDNYIRNPVIIPGLNISINNLFFKVKYNNNDIIFTNQPSITLYSSQTIPLSYTNGTYYSNSLKSYNPILFDVSFSFITDKLSTLVYPGTHNRILENTDSYTAKCYLGYINISNITLITSPGYVYDFYLKINMSNINFPDPTNNFYDNYIKTTTGPYIFANVSKTTNFSDNCILHTLSSNPPIINSLSFSGS